MLLQEIMNLRVTGILGAERQYGGAMMLQQFKSLRRYDEIKRSLFKP